MKQKFSPRGRLPITMRPAAEALAAIQPVTGDLRVIPIRPG